MSLCRYRRFRKPLWCPGASGTGFRKKAVSEGDLISYKERYEDGSWAPRLARVLGLATHGGDGVKYGKPRLAVLAASDMLDHGYERHVDLDDVLEAMDATGSGSFPERRRDFARFFLFGEMPGPEDAAALSRHGSMSDGHVAKYLTSPEGAVRKDWRGLAGLSRPKDVSDRMSDADAASVVEELSGVAAEAGEEGHGSCACCPRCHSPAPWSCGHYDRDGNEIPEEA